MAYCDQVGFYNHSINFHSPLVFPLLIGHTVYSPPSPAGGPLLLFIMNVMGDYEISASNRNEELSQLNLIYQRLVETFKYGFALRTRLGDPSCALCSDNAEEILALQYNMTA